MIDVATAAGVSRTTASFVLNGRDRSIPLETQQKVRCVARQMGYRPNAAAIALATGRTNRIGIVLNEPSSFLGGDMYYSHVLAGIVGSALRHNRNLLLHSAKYADWHDLYGEILGGATDGTLLVGRFAADELTPALLDAGIPTVCISFEVDHPNSYVVDCDNEQGGFESVRHLTSLGHRQIAFLYPGDVSWGRERLSGARSAILAAGLPQQSLACFEWSETERPNAGWIDAALGFITSLDPPATGLVCCEELRIESLVDGLQRLGIRVPQDLAVVSFNSTEHSERARPPLTSVAQPLEEIGSAALDLLMERIDGQEPERRSLRFAMRLDVRDSCGMNAGLGREAVCVDSR